MYNINHMIQAKVISGGSEEERKNLAHDLIFKALNLAKDTLWESISQHPDLFLFSAPGSIGIEEIRETEYQIQLKPYFFPLKISFIENADRLTIEAQNAFLKTLEEPPSHCLIILSVEKKSSLLPTVLSRCQIINLPGKVQVELNDDEEKILTKSFDTILNGDIGQKFLCAETWGKDKKSAEEALAKISMLGQKLLLAPLISHETKNQDLDIKTKRRLVNFLHQIITYRKYLDANINPRFTLENLFLSC